MQESRIHPSPPPIAPEAGSLSPSARPRALVLEPRALNVGRAPRAIFDRLKPALVAFSGALLVALLDPAYAAATGEVLTVAGLRLSVLAGALLLAALGLALRELVRGEDSG